MPFGTDTCGVVGVVPLDVVAEGWVALVALGVAELAGVGDDDVVADDDGGAGAGGGGASAGAASAGGSGAGGGGSGAGGGGATGLIGLTGLVGFVAFVKLFSHEFTVSTQGPTSGCP